jgi:hypothetical protein
MSIQPAAAVAYSQGNITWYLGAGRGSNEWANIKIFSDPVFKGRGIHKAGSRSAPSFSSGLGGGEGG